MTVLKALWVLAVTFVKSPFTGMVFRAYMAGAFGMMAVGACMIGPAAAAWFFGIISIAAVISVFAEAYSAAPND